MAAEALWEEIILENSLRDMNGDARLCTMFVRCKVIAGRD
jgi:hypothetical protein